MGTKMSMVMIIGMRSKTDPVLLLHDWAFLSGAWTWSFGMTPLCHGVSTELRSYLARSTYYTTAHLKSCFFQNLFSLATKKMKAGTELEKIGKFVSVRLFFLSHFLVTMGWIPLIIEDGARWNNLLLFQRRREHTGRKLSKNSSHFYATNI